MLGCRVDKVIQEGSLPFFGHTRWGAGKRTFRLGDLQCPGTSVGRHDLRIHRLPSACAFSQALICFRAAGGRARSLTGRRRLAHRAITLCAAGTGMLQPHSRDVQGAPRSTAANVIARITLGFLFIG